MNDPLRICTKCGYQSKGVFLNQECNHSFCQNCLLQISRLSQQTQIFCLVETCKKRISVKQIMSFFEQEKKEQQITQSQIRQQSNIMQSTMKSKQYQSPNELNYEQRQQLFKEMKVEVSKTLNYCALCLFYIEERNLKHQKQCNERDPVLGCRKHALCTLCIIKFYEHYREKQYFCEICERLNK